MSDAVIYARFSCSKQREESIEDQVRVCTEAAQRAGDRIVRVYSDSAMSGKTDERPQFLRMVKDADRGEWSRVYVYKLDRFARNRYDSATYKARLRRCGVAVVSAAESIPDGPDGILLESLYEGMAEYYSANLSQNVKRGMDGNARKCMSNGTSIYGYRRGDDGTYVVVEDEARVVRMLFDAYASGRSVNAIVQHELKPYRTRRGNPFSAQTACKMLRNERYVGVYLYDGVRVEGGMPAIIDRRQFDMAQERLSRRHRRSTGTAGFPLTGLVVDVNGNTYGGSTGTGKSGKTYRYYYSARSGVRVNADELEDVVARAVELMLSDGLRDAVVDAVASLADEQAAEDAATADSLERRIAANEREQRNVIDFVAAAGVSDAMVERIHALEDEHRQLADALADARNAAPTVTREMVAFWLEDRCRARDAGALAPALVTQVLLNENGASGIVFLAMDGGSVPIARPDVFDLSQRSAENETPSQVGGCSSKSVLVGRFDDKSNTYQVEVLPLIVAVRYGRAA